MKCTVRDLEVMGSNVSQVKLEVRSCGESAHVSIYIEYCLYISVILKLRMQARKASKFKIGIILKAVPKGT